LLFASNVQLLLLFFMTIAGCKVFIGHMFGGAAWFMVDF
jgi:hypothetical protein